MSIEQITIYRYVCKDKAFQLLYKWLFNFRANNSLSWDAALLPHPMLYSILRYQEQLLEVANELSPWLKKQYAAGASYVGVADEFDRAPERRRQQREAYPVAPKFYEEVRVIDEGLSSEQRECEYREFLRKYNIPSCFYPFPM